MAGAKFKNPRLARDYWKIPNYYRNFDKVTPFAVGQQLLVRCDDHGYIPCIPKPASDSRRTRVPTGEWVIYIGPVDFNGSLCHEFIHGIDVTHDKIANKSFYIGEGSFQFLANIPKKNTKAPSVRFNSRHRKKAGSPVGFRGGVKRKPRANKKRPGAGLDKAPPPKSLKSDAN